MTVPVRRLARLGLADWAMLVRAARALIVAQLAYGRRPVQELIRDLRARSDVRAASPRPTGHQERRIERLRWALAALERRMPFRSDCVFQVLAAERISLAWGLAPKFFLGVEPGPEGFSAHVWLEVGGLRITGGSVDHLSVMIGQSDDGRA